MDELDELLELEGNLIASGFGKGDVTAAQPVEYAACPRRLPSSAPFVPAQESRTLRSRATTTVMNWASARATSSAGSLESTEGGWTR
eukprot:1286697-Prymnesium_polylepis.1